MKVVFWLIIGLGMIVLILLLGNSLQCSTTTGVAVCPSTCNSKPAVCDPELADLKNCQAGLDCYAPKLDDYPRIIESYLEVLKPKKKL